MFDQAYSVYYKIQKTVENEIQKKNALYFRYS